ncbi:MAG: 3(or 17)beta-hydroxysteroid dehydrogenase [Candidatus Azotimanducaceae bacterium]|jgi:NAD(P)-dependent dehydrogenase (short-subunit alcohol dehydrogenase family)
MTGRVEGKIALVTAAGDGIGEAIGRRLAGEGATVVLTDLDGGAVEAIANDLGGGAMGLAHDAGDPGDWQSVIDAVKERHGKLDVLVNNAGVSRAGNIEEQSLEDLQFVIRVNLEGTFLGCKHAIDLMKGGGSIINISSIHGIQAAPHEAAYSATKGAVKLLTKSVAMHCADKGYNIRCNSVHPGYIMTTMMEKWLEASDDRAALEGGLIAKHPIGFLGSPEDIAHGALYLASDEARFVTGSEMVIDGGYLM